MRRTILVAVALVGALLAIPTEAQAQPGTGLAQIARPAGCTGIGVAFDGTRIIYTCSVESAVRFTDLSGADLGMVATADALGVPVSVDAIAWDPNEGVLWGGDLDGQGSCRIWSIDLTSGLATLRFSFVDPHGGCDFFFFDGLTVDTVTDTLWLSPDVHAFIHHYTKAGVEIPGDLIDFATLTSDDCGGGPCPNSGLTIGLDGNLFAGTNGFGLIFQIDPGPPAANLGQFASVTGRDEDLECGPEFEKPDGTMVETILSADLIENKIDVLEAPEETCLSPVVPPEIRLDPPEDTNEAGTDHTVTATVTQEGNPVPGVLVSFEVLSGPNAGETSDPGECTPPGCLTDPNGMVSWTYTGALAVGTDLIEACIAGPAGEEICARAEKDWVDTTPPTVECIETVNPHGSKVPPAGSTTLPGPKGGQNEDGFYEVSASDALDPNPAISLKDGGSGFVFPGPFANPDRVKYTQAPGATPSQNKLGSTNGQAGAISYHLTGTGDLVVTATDFSGNTTTVTCLVPPPPK